MSKGSCPNCGKGPVGEYYVCSKCQNNYCARCSSEHARRCDGSAGRRVVKI